MREIKDRQDVSVIVRSFYARVREDEALGPIFNSIITDWEEHLEKLTDFWTMQLFGGRPYAGNPIQAHQAVDKESGRQIDAFHFGIWLNLWFATIDADFTGDNADLLKHRARKMQTPIMIAVYEGRQ